MRGHARAGAGARRWRACVLASAGVRALGL